MITPKKSLGQNFLTDKNISKKIVSAVTPERGDYILEIGPGTGALTELLTDTPAQVLAVEIDARAVADLDKKFSSRDNLKVIRQDISKFNFAELDDFSGGALCKVVGNIPYYLTSEIIFILIANSARISKIVLMIQKEVAQRLVAKPRTKEYGILTVAMDLCSNVKMLFDVPPSCFFPRPKVTSSVIEIAFKPAGENLFTPELMKLVRMAFNQRRKTLRNALAQYSIDAIPACSDYLTKRAEELSAMDFYRLYHQIQAEK